MHRIKRSLFVFLALILLPLSPARAQQTDDTLWSGKITVHWTHRAAWSLPGGLETLEGSLQESFTSIIFPSGDGYATQIYTYNYKLYGEMWCGGAYVGTYTQEASATYSYPAQPFSMSITELQAIAEFPQPGIQATHVDTQCGEHTGEAIQLHDYDASHLSPDDGEFSPDSTEVNGHSKYSTFYPTYGGNDGWEVFTFVTVYNLTGTEEDTEWLPQPVKDLLGLQAEVNNQVSPWLGAAAGICFVIPPCTPMAGPIGAAAGGSFVSGQVQGRLAEDPPDPNFTEIALPVTPTTSQQPVLASGDLTQAQADAFNAFMENDEQAIGLARVILTSFNRASGALVANNTYWMEQQLQAARGYSGQYADVLDARPQLLQDLQQALETHPSMPLDITSEDIALYHYDLVTNGLSAEQEQLLTELGVDARGRAEILQTMILADYPQETSLQDPVAQFPDLLTDPELIQSTHDLVILLREFAAAEGWKMYLPLLGR